MKSNENKKTDRIEKDEQAGRVQDTKAPQEAIKTQALAAVHGLQTGEWSALSPGMRGEAVGLLGNQNALRLMETGAEAQHTMAEASAQVDTLGLANVLSGPPSGPVCAMDAM